MHGDEAELVAETGGAVDESGAAVQRDDDGQVDRHLTVVVGDQAPPEATFHVAAHYLDGAGVELRDQPDALPSRLLSSLLQAGLVNRSRGVT